LKRFEQQSTDVQGESDTESEEDEVIELVRYLKDLTVALNQKMMMKKQSDE
jgi:hypothetical protein